LDGANQAITHPDVSIEYSNDDSLDVEATTSAVFFTNPYMFLCDAIISCSIKAAGCSTAYTNGNLVIDAASGKIEAKKNVDAGYVDKVCIKC
jgi:hypothetical protein